MIDSQGVIHRDGPDLAWFRWTSSGGGRGATARPCIVLAHGITDSAACWTRLAEHLTAELAVDVVALDARGHGRSERATDYGFAAGVDDLTAACAALGLQHPVLVGHSMGGPHVTAAAPLVRAAAVAVIDPHWPLNPQDDTTYDVTWRRGVAQESATELDDLVRQGRIAHPGWHEEDLTAWAAAKRQVDPAVTSWVSDHEPINDWRQTVARLRCPLLVITGDRAADPEITVDENVLTQVRATQPGAEHHHVAAAGHSVHRDDFASVSEGFSASFAVCCPEGFVSKTYRGS